MDSAASELSVEVPPNIISDAVLVRVTATDGINTASDASDAAFSIRTTRERGGCFAAAMKLGEGVDDFVLPKLAAAGPNAYLCWAEVVTGKGLTVKLRASRDGGKTFAEAVALSRHRDSVGTSRA